jgi:hypothetical protein
MSRGLQSVLGAAVPLAIPGRHGQGKQDMDGTDRVGQRGSSRHFPFIMTLYSDFSRGKQLVNLEMNRSISYGTHI